jgi:hypothetical protein
LDLTKTAENGQEQPSHLVLKDQRRPSIMGIEYKIKFAMPRDFNPSALLNKLPSPIDGTSIVEIYNYAVESDGFYFVDHLVSRDVASVALRLFLDEALVHSPSVQIIEP